MSAMNTSYSKSFKKVTCPFKLGSVKEVIPVNDGSEIPNMMVAMKTYGNNISKLEKETLFEFRWIS